MASDLARVMSNPMPGSFGARYSLANNLSREREPANERRSTDPAAQVQSPTTPLSPPSAPSPSQDAGLVPDIAEAVRSTASIKSPSLEKGALDITDVEPVVAMKLLARGVQGLAHLTGEVVPTPPIMVQAVKPRIDGASKQHNAHRRTLSRPGTPLPSADVHKADFEYVGPPEAQPGEFSAGDQISDPEPQQTQTIVRKFYCKTPPPVSLEAYLVRMHRYCPMSPAVYLAAGVYIQKLCIEDKVVPATSRTVHRLLLASLRVAMKALEDLRYSQERFAFVGGVKQEELRNLEISLCYLLDFRLQVTPDKLRTKMGGLLDAAKVSSGLIRDPMPLSLPIRRLPS